MSLLLTFVFGEEGLEEEHAICLFLLAPLCSSDDACQVSVMRHKKILFEWRRFGENWPNFGALESCCWLWQQEFHEFLLFQCPSRHRRKHGYVMSASFSLLLFRALKQGVPKMCCLRCSSSPPSLEKPNPPSLQCRWEPRSRFA